MKLFNTFYIFLYFIIFLLECQEEIKKYVKNFERGVEIVKPNEILRKYAKNKSVRFWEIADAMKKSEATLTRLFRHELSDEQKADFIKIIEEIAAKKATA